MRCCIAMGKQVAAGKRQVHNCVSVLGTEVSSDGATCHAGADIKAEYLDGAVLRRELQ